MTGYINIALSSGASGSTTTATSIPGGQALAVIPLTQGAYNSSMTMACLAVDSLGNVEG